MEAGVRVKRVQKEEGWNKRGLETGWRQSQERKKIYGLFKARRNPRADPAKCKTCKLDIIKGGPAR